MAAHVLVLAHRTAASPELIEALKARQEKGPIHATLVLPADGPGTGSRDVCRKRIDKALAAWREAGIKCDGVIGDPSPLQALLDARDPMHHDEVIVCTLPGQSSKWLRSDLPRTVYRATGLRTTHVVARDPEAAPHGAPLPEKEHSSLGPLSVMAWGHPQEESS
jgi:hypothetical protein